MLLAAFLAGCGCTDHDGASPAAPVTGTPGTGQQVAVAQGVAGTVTTSAGDPVEGAMIVPTPLDSPAPAIPEMAVRSGPDGRYSWNLPPGRYEVTIRKEGFRAAVKRVEVRANEMAVADFVLEKLE